MSASYRGKHQTKVRKMQKFHMYVIDSRTIHKNHVCGVDDQGNWQLADKISASRYPELEPMEMTTRQIHLATKQLKDCISGKYRTIEIIPA